MKSRRHRTDRAVVAQAGLLVVACTLALTACFVGLVALLVGAVSDIGARFPYYVLATGLAFAGGIISFEGEFDRAGNVLQLAALSGVGTFVVVALTGEGIAYALRRPEQVLTSHLFLYLFAAGLIGFGIGYWGMIHWEEVIGNRQSL